MKTYTIEDVEKALTNEWLTTEEVENRLVGYNSSLLFMLEDLVRRGKALALRRGGERIWKGVGN